MEHLAEPFFQHLGEPLVEHLAEPFLQHLGEMLVEHLAEPFLQHLGETLLEHFAEPFLQHLEETLVEHLAEQLLQYLGETLVEHLAELFLQHLRETLVWHLAECGHPKNCFGGFVFVFRPSCSTLERHLWSTSQSRSCSTPGFTDDLTLLYFGLVVGASMPVNLCGVYATLLSVRPCQSAAVCASMPASSLLGVFALQPENLTIPVAVRAAMGCGGPCTFQLGDVLVHGTG